MSRTPKSKPEPEQTQRQRQRDREIMERFLEFHSANPDIFELLVDYCRKLKRRGYQTGSIYAIYERVRWELMEEAGPDANGIGIDNNYRPYYARLIMTTYPQEFAGFFKVRRLRSRKQ